MKKLLYVLIGLVVFGVAALAIGWFYLGPIITKAVNTAGPKITGTRVELASADLSPLTGGGTLKGLFVGNPSGWKSDKAFYLGEIRLKVVPSSLLGDPIVVEEIYIDQPEFVYETTFTRSNIGDLLKQIEANTGGPRPAGEEPAAEPAGPPRKFIIKQFTFQNAKVTAGFGPSSVTVTIPSIAISDLGVKEGGITADQAAVAVMRVLTAEIGKVAATSALKAAAQGDGSLKDMGKQATEGLKKLIGQ